MHTARQFRKIIETDQRVGEAWAESCLCCELHNSLLVAPEGAECLSLALVIHNSVKRCGVA